MYYNSNNESKTLHKSISTPTLKQSGNDKKHLRFAMLGCENSPPYGPNQSTAQMFLELLSKAQVSAYNMTNTEVKGSSIRTESTNLSISIDIFHVQILQYPENWDLYDGILIPGSTHSAHDTSQEWINYLKKIIHQEIHSKCRKTLGICFGHQILANYLQNDFVIPCPSGSQAGAITSSIITPDISRNRGYPFHACKSNSLKLYYTHGDMVCKLPPNAIPLAKSPNVPFQIIAYQDNTSKNKYYAYSFQAHLEYATSEYGQKTFVDCVKMMESKEHISKDIAQKSINDIDANFEFIKEESIQLAIIVGRELGWFCT